MLATHLLRICFVQSNGVTNPAHHHTAKAPASSKRSSRPIQEHSALPFPDRFPSTINGGGTDALPGKVKCLGMDTNQTRIIELLREVHLIAFKEMERLNLRIVELENQNRQQLETISKPAVSSPPVVNPPKANPPSFPQQEMLTDKQVTEYLNMSVSLLHQWRMSRKEPNFVKIGRAVRYKRGDVETWMDSLPGLR